MRNWTEAVPALAQHANDAPRLDDIEVDVLVDVGVQKKITGEHRDADRVAHSATPAPDADLRQKDIETLCLQLVRDELLRVAVRPDRVPLRIGSAPFDFPGWPG